MAGGHITEGGCPSNSATKPLVHLPLTLSRAVRADGPRPFTPENAMPSFAYARVNVFTGDRFGGNPLAVLPDARGLSDEQMQAIARDFNLSETTFVLPPDNPRHHARVR